MGRPGKSGILLAVSRLFSLALCRKDVTAVKEPNESEVR